MEPESHISFSWSNNYYAIKFGDVQNNPLRLGSVSSGLYLHNNYLIRKTYSPQNEK